MRRTRIAFLITLTAFCDCDKPAVAKQPPAPAIQYIVGLDLSTSRSVESLRDARKLLDDVIEARLRNGDELVLLEMYGGAASAEHQWIDSVPAARGVPADERRLTDFKAVSHQVVGALFEGARARHINNTDVLGTLNRAADYAKAAHGRTPMLLLLSDMEQSTPSMRMENDQAIPPKTWVRSLKAGGRLPDLGGICVIVSGAGTSTAHEARLRDFWLDYMAVTQARLAPTGYRRFIADASELRCR